MARLRELQLILILISVAVLLVIFTPFFKGSATQEEASKFVLQDLESKYPAAEIEILSISNKTNDLGQVYFELKSRVTKYQNSKCPERSHIFYNYPEQNFVATPEEVITNGCKICADGICTIAFKEEAIIASHTLKGTEMASQFLKYNPDAVPIVYEGNDSWSILWEAQGGSFQVNLLRNGTIKNQTSFN